MNALRTATIRTILVIGAVAFFACFSARAVTAQTIDVLINPPCANSTCIGLDMIAVAKHLLVESDPMLSYFEELSFEVACAPPQLTGADVQKQVPGEIWEFPDTFCTNQGCSPGIGGEVCEVTGAAAEFDSRTAVLLGPETNDFRTPEELATDPPVTGDQGIDAVSNRADIPEQFADVEQAFSDFSFDDIEQSAEEFGLTELFAGVAAAAAAEALANGGGSSSPPPGCIGDYNLVYSDPSGGLSPGGRARRITTADGTEAMRIDYPDGVGSNFIRTNRGVVDGNGARAAIFSVDVSFSDNFIAPVGRCGGKFFGVAGGCKSGIAAGGATVCGQTDYGNGPGGSGLEGGWSSRVALSSSGNFALYSYYQNRNEQGASRNSDGRLFGKTSSSNQSLNSFAGRTVNFQQEVIMNDPGMANGVERLYMDGQLIVENTGIMWQRESDKYGVDGFYIANMWGGNTNSPDCRTNPGQYMIMQNFGFYTADGGGEC